MALFNTWSNREQQLSAAARRLSAAADALLGRLTAAPAGDIGGGVAELRAFDAAWSEYLGLFAAWKGRDVAALEVRLHNLHQSSRRSAAALRMSALDLHQLSSNVIQV